MCNMHLHVVTCYTKTCLMQLERFAGTIHLSKQHRTNRYQHIKTSFRFLCNMQSRSHGTYYGFWNTCRPISYFVSSWHFHQNQWQTARQDILCFHLVRMHMVPLNNTAHIYIWPRCDYYYVYVGLKILSVNCSAHLLNCSYKA